MKKSNIVLILIALIPSLSFCQITFNLPDEYNFLQREGKVFKVFQSNDTLYEVRKSIYNQNFVDPRKHYKIHGFKELPNYHILKLEQLDTIPLTTDSYPLNRYLVIAIKEMNEKQLGYLPISGGLSKHQLDSFTVNEDSLAHKFFYTYFSNESIKTFGALKEITTKDDVKRILKLMKSKQYKVIINSWENTETGDIWGTGLTAELLNKASLELGYNPIGADQKISTLVTKL